MVNALQAVNTELDSRSKSYVRLEGNYIQSDGSMATEEKLFDGAENPLVLLKEYYQTFSCQFQLHYYPFDVQECKMCFQIMEMTKDYITISEETSSVNFTGEYRLIIYGMPLCSLPSRQSILPGV